MLKKLLTQWREARARQAYRNGWDWMAGELLLGQQTAEDLEVQLDFTFDSSNAFDYGAQAALQAWEARETLRAGDRPLWAALGCCGGIH